MGINTTKLGLLKPSENDFYNQQTEQAENWEKVDKFADDIQNLVDNNSGKKITGYIQDEGEKILGNYYLDKLVTGLFKCIKSGNINYNSADYFEDYSNYANGNKLQNLFTEIYYYNDYVQEIDLTNVPGRIFFVHLRGQVKAVGSTDNYVGSSAFIVMKNDIARSFQLQVQGSGPQYVISVNFSNNKLFPNFIGDVNYGIAGQILRLL